MYNYGYNAPCAAPLSGFYGLGAALTPAQRKANVLARQTAAKAKRTAAQAAAKTKRAVKVAGKTVVTSNPAAAAKLHAAVMSAQQQLSNALSLAATARKTRNKVDVSKALVAAQSAGKFINTLAAPVQPPVVAQKLRGLGYTGDLSSCVDDGSGSGMLIDNGDGQGCDPTTGQPTGGAYLPPANPVYPGTQYPGVSTGVVPGFGLPTLPTFGSTGYGPLRACATGSNLPRCIIYQMAQDEQTQFQYVFSLLQQMYAQLLSIVQQLLGQLQSAQQSPYAYGQQPYNPYGTNPYDPNNPYGQGYGAGYGGQYPGPGGYPGAPYYAGGGDSSVIPPGYGDSGDMSAGVPGDVSQVFPGPSSGGGGGYPIQSYGGPPPGLISSDSLPDGADPTSGGDGGDDAAGLIPTSGSGPNLPAMPSGVSQSTAAPITAQPQIIVLQQGPGQSPYSDAGLPAGDKQNQPLLDPPEHDDSGLTGW